MDALAPLNDKRAGLVQQLEGREGMQQGLHIAGLGIGKRHGGAPFGKAGTMRLLPLPRQNL